MTDSAARRVALCSTLALALGVGAAGLAAQNRASDAQPALRLEPTVHPPLPFQPSQFWLVPSVAFSDVPSAAPSRDTAATKLAQAVKLIGDGKFTVALPLIRASELSSSPLAAYAQYYLGVALQGLSKLPDAEAAYLAAAARKPEGYLSEALPLRLAEVAQARQDPQRALNILSQLTGDTLSAPEEFWLRLAHTAEAAGKPDAALTAYRRVYYEFPLSAQAIDAQAGIERLETPDRISPNRYKEEYSRAETLFAAKRWAQARAAFDPLSRAAQGDDAQLMALRVAECDYYLGRYSQARERLSDLLDKGPRKAEARFFYLTATGALGRQDEYVKLARTFVDDFPDSSWSEEALNNLGSHYIIVDDDATADEVFRELYRRFPKSEYAERAAWKIGWRAYRSGAFGEAANLFEQAAADFPRADNRPAFLYWSARARDQMGEEAAAIGRYRVAIADYQNSYYGRLAEKRLAGRTGVIPVATSAPVAHLPTAATVSTDALIRQLVSLDLYDDALREVRYAQRVWGDSAALKATVAFIRHNQGLSLSANERFDAIRGAIRTMRQAYPQFMAAGGEDLPPEVLRIIFPLDYWPLITKYSKQHDLDPYLVAALMAQESTFTAEIVSGANAYGLMQLVPAAGRQYARKLGIRGFKTSMLTNPETNVRMGTLYFKELTDRFDGASYALASYNAGPARVAEWLKERPDLPQDEFIDDIPFPETKNYVKRILGTAEDYRHLYGGGLLDPNEGNAGGSVAAPAPRQAPASVAPRAPKAAKKPARKAPSKRRR